jgi:septum formation protein
MSAAPDAIHTDIILASGSPRRAELLSQAGYVFRTVVPTIPEPDTGNPEVTPAEEAEALSYFKARAVAGTVPRGLILGADTLVAHDGKVFGKPRDREHAREILSSLMGTTHEVITGVTLLDADDGRRAIEHDTTRVTMRRLTPGELAGYLDSQAWEGKAGAYGIQDEHDPFVQRIEGSFSNVVGLPLERLADMLAQWFEVGV